MWLCRRSQQQETRQFYSDTVFIPLFSREKYGEISDEPSKGVVIVSDWGGAKDSHVVYRSELGKLKATLKKGDVVTFYRQNGITVTEIIGSLSKP